jgi:hypothetical protein
MDQRMNETRRVSIPTFDWVTAGMFRAQDHRSLRRARYQTDSWIEERRRQDDGGCTHKPFGRCGAYRLGRPYSLLLRCPRSMSFLARRSATSMA